MSLTYRQILATAVWACTLQGIAFGQALTFSGQAIGWSTLNPVDPFRFQPGLRYIPEISFSLPAGHFSLDAELSANLWSRFMLPSGDSLQADHEISPYRMWVRFSGNRFELRAGLQKINFGSATLFRPLMWFDRMDPRDPLQLTDGVYGLLGRYYFLNNANIWLWGLYGEHRTKGWEILPTAGKTIEYGGRAQVPLFTGEIAASYHHRRADPTGVVPDSVSQGNTYPENRVGFDAKMDLGAGLWTEVVLVHQDLDYTGLTFKTLLNGGMDYSLRIGNGLRLMTEYFAYLQGESPFGAGEHVQFGLMSASYPINIIHNLGVMVFYDFTHTDLYRFVNWSQTYDRWTFYVMGFWNPDTYNLYNLDSRTTLYSGWGFQLMAVFNH